MTWDHAPIPTYAERLAVSQAVVRWGFPRPLDPTEILSGRWFRMGYRVVWWFERPLFNLPGALVLHLAVSPDVRSRWPVRAWRFHMEREARALGASQIVVAPHDDVGHVAAYLRRLGWVHDPPAWVLHLGG